MGLESLIPKKSSSQNNTSPVPPKTESRDTSDAPYPFSSRSVPKEDSTWPHKELQAEALTSNKRVLGFPKHTDSFREQFNVKSEKENELSNLKKQNEAVFHIEVEKIRPNPYQPRKHFDQNALRELAESIREFGVIQPIIVSKITRESEHGAHVEYQLIAGERRLMASKLVGLPSIPAIVRNISMDNKREKLEVALIENIQRHDLNVIDEARAYTRLSDEFGLTQQAIAERVGKSREVVANTMRLLNLSREMQEALVLKKINESHARLLLSVKDSVERETIFRKILGEKMAARGVQNVVKLETPKDPQEKFWERQLEEKLGAPVKIVRSAQGGKIVITFYSDEEKSGVLKRIVGEEGI